MWLPRQFALIGALLLLPACASTGSEVAAPEAEEASIALVGLAIDTPKSNANPIFLTRLGEEAEVQMDAGDGTLAVKVRVDALEGERGYVLDLVYDDGAAAPVHFTRTLANEEVANFDFEPEGRITLRLAIADDTSQAKSIMKRWEQRDLLAPQQAAPGS